MARPGINVEFFSDLLFVRLEWPMARLRSGISHVRSGYIQYLARSTWCVFPGADALGSKAAMDKMALYYARIADCLRGLHQRCSCPEPSGASSRLAIRASIPSKVSDYSKASFNPIVSVHTLY
ncbi:MAG TPA: hypothetical protein VKZ53_07425 [Candidatus Angelobacter sp.]|nr:hypothetical protein [Candidatus Angelobacter sp.]